jgi:hypothetical protein
VVERLTYNAAGTNPIHNKKPKAAKKELDDDDKAYLAKQQAGMWYLFYAIDGHLNDSSKPCAGQYG